MRKSFAFTAFSLLAATPSFAAPADDILAANKAATAGPAWDSKAGLKIEYAYSGQGLTGTTDSLQDLKTGHFVDSYDLGAVTGAQGFDGTHGWGRDQSGTITSQDGGDALAAAVDESYRNANLWWNADHGGAAITDTGTKTEGGVTYDTLNVVPKGGEPFDAWFDAKTHLLTRTFERVGTAPTTTTFSDYRAVDGVMIPGKFVVSTGDAKYDQTQTLKSATFIAEPDPSAFEAPKTQVADYSIANGAKETSFPFQLLNNHIYAEARIDGHGPYTFIFDTGGVNVVTPPLAKQLGLKIEGHIEARGAGAGTMDSGFLKVARLDLGDATVKDQVFVSIPLNTMENTEGFPQPGMIGFETFRRFVTRIDYGKHTITLIDPKSFDPKDAGTPVPITFDGNVVEAVGSYDGATGKFMIDTGARTALTLSAPFVDKNGLRTKAGKGVEAMTGWGIGGPTRSYVEHGDTLMIGTVPVDGPLVLLSTDVGGAMDSGNIAGNIGGGVLKRFAITFDYGHAVMYLKPVEGHIPDLDTFDRAGVWINKDDSGAFKVIDVTKSAPADEAGLKTGDMIVAVDGKPVSTLSLADLRYRLRNDAPGTVMSFTVKRGAATQDIHVTLRDLV
jgi:hypothetical protein